MNLSTRSLRVAALAAVSCLTACSKEKPAEVTTSAARSTAQPQGAPARAAERLRDPVVTFKGVGLATPESVLHDPTTDQYLVSNVNGEPLAKDGNGFIARLSPDGNVATLKWIEGNKGGVTLNAPKGMTFRADRLYVTDIDTVRIFDRQSGAPVGEVKVPGATFLNDLVTTSDGRVLVSDTGAETSAVHAIDDKDQLTTIAKSKELGRPNGLLAEGGDVWVVTFGSDELYALDAQGKRTRVQKLPKGSLDGITRPTAGGDLLVSSWDASGVFRGKPGGDFTLVLEGIKAPADIGFDEKRSRLLLPMFENDEVRVYDVARP